MNTDTTKTNPPDAQFGADNKMKRTLFIALGGSGIEVLRSVRLQMVAKYGPPRGFPAAKYLCIDTDKGALDSFASDGPESRLAEQEWINIGIAKNEIDPKSVPKWFESGQFRGTVDGAGAARQNGRISLWMKHGEVGKRIEQCLRSLAMNTVGTTMRERHDLDIDNHINVYVIYGMGGGTGAGIFLDVAYLVRKIAQQLDYKGVTFIGCGAMPQVAASVQGAPHTVKPNGYAALKELNYYTYHYQRGAALSDYFGEPEWKAHYGRGSEDRVEFKNTPPFDLCYLFDAGNDANPQISRADLHQMIGTSLFMDFMGGISTSRWSDRNNDIQGLRDNPQDASGLPQSFSSFGMAVLEVPLLAIEELIAIKWSLGVARRWMAGGESFSSAKTSISDPVAPELIDMEAFRSRSNKLAAEATAVATTEFLSRFSLTEEQLQTFYLGNAFQRIEQYREEIKRRWVSEDWKKNDFIGKLKTITEDMHKQYDISLHHNDSAWQGAMRELRDLKLNHPYGKEPEFNRIRGWAYEAFIHSKKGPAWAVCAIRCARERLGSMRRDFSAQAENPLAPVYTAKLLNDFKIIDVRAADNLAGRRISGCFDAKLTELLTEVEHAVNKKALLGNMREIRANAGTYIDYLAGWCKACYLEESLRQRARLMDFFINERNGLLSRLVADLEASARNLSNFERALISLHKKCEDKINTAGSYGRMLCNKAVMDNIEEKIRTSCGDDAAPAHLAAEIEREAKTRGVKRYYRIAEADVDKCLLAPVQRLIKRAVRDNTASRLVNIYEILGETHSAEGQLEAELEAVVGKALPYVRLRRNLAGETTDEHAVWEKSRMPANRSGCGLLNGAANDNEPAKGTPRDKFITALSKLEGWAEVVRQGRNMPDTRDFTRVVFFYEYAGFPLRAVMGTESLKDSYLSYMENRHRGASAPLHITSPEDVQYPDLYPPSNPAVLERAKSLQVAGLVLKYIKRSKGRYVYYKKADSKTKYRAPVDISAAPERIAFSLVDNEKALVELEALIKEDVKAATDSTKNGHSKKLKSHLDALEKRLIAEADTSEDQGNVKSSPEYTGVLDSITKFMHTYDLPAFETDAPASYVSDPDPEVGP